MSEDSIDAPRRDTWGEGLRLIAVGYGRVEFTGTNGAPQKKTVTVNVPPETRAIYVGVTGVKTPADMAGAAPAAFGGLMFNIVKNTDDGGDVIVTGGKFTFDATALIRHAGAAGSWSMKVPVEVMCFA